jgi:hypothetical protein
LLNVTLASTGGDKQRIGRLADISQETLMTKTLRLLSLFVLGFVALLATGVGHAQITPLGDSYTNTADPTKNYGSQTLLDVDGVTQITYIQFDLASIPTTASISQATLKLYVNSVTTAGSFNVDYVNGAWTESTIDASKAPALGTTIASGISITTADKNQYILINVTSAVQAWLSGSETNNGIALVADGSFDATFDSKESTSTSHPAELDIAFAGGDGTITGVTTASGSGLSGGGTSGTLNLSLTNSCAASQVLQWNGSAWACASAGTGTITGVTAGTDLTGGGTSGTVTLNLNTNVLAAYAQLGANNTFTGVQEINNVTTINGTNSLGMLQVTNTGTSGGNPAIVGTTNSTGASGVKGVASASSGTTIGVAGVNSSSGGYGVVGQSAYVGVYGDGTGSTTGYGVVAESPNIGVSGSSDGASGTGAGSSGVGVWGDTGGPANGGYTGVLGTADENVAAYFQNNSSSNDTLDLENSAKSSSSAIVLSTLGFNFDGTCTINVSGDLACSGSKSAVVKVDGGSRRVKLYAVEAPENWFEDAGSGQLSNGAARIELDPTFAQTVNASLDYHVFLTPNGDCKGLYVSQKSATSFEVHELGGGNSNITFDYRIMAKRSGYENVRLADVTEQYQRMEQQQKMRRERMQQRRAAQSATAPIAAAVKASR